MKKLIEIFMEIYEKIKQRRLEKERKGKRIRKDMIDSIRR